MVESLQKEKVKVPKYLESFKRDLDGERPKSKLTAISNSVLKYLPMGYVQAAEVNKCLAEQKEYESLLSPGQKTLLDKIKKNPDVNWPEAQGKEFLQAWSKVEGFLKKNK